jgi:protein arginine N-methyltransferase 1
MLSDLSDIQGLNLAPLQHRSKFETEQVSIEETKLLSVPSRLVSFDLRTVTESQLEFSAPFKLHFNRRGTTNALVGWFDVYFILPTPLKLSTSPHAPETHWYQTQFHLHNPQKVKCGDTSSGQVKLSKFSNGLAIALNYRGRKCHYQMM